MFRFSKPDKRLNVDIDGEFKSMTELLDYIVDYLRRDNTTIWGDDTWHFLLGTSYNKELAA